MDESKPKIILEPHLVLCATHGEPLRRRWPAGYAVFALSLFRVVVESDAFAEELGLIPPDTPGDLQLLTLAVKPLCCRVKDLDADTLVEIYNATEIGVPGLCVRCMRTGLGTPYKYRNFWGREKWYNHVCFQCVAHRLPHA